jgi:hypothetical protein
MGTQTWHSPRGQNGSRTCTAALVLLAATDRSPQQSLPDQSSPQQSLPDQSPSQQ